MTARYFVVEGKTDEFILKQLLPKSVLHDTKIIVGEGYSSALSAVQSLFVMTPLPVSFFFDTDTCSEEQIEEKKQFINSYLKKISGNKFLLFPMKPAIEILFFQDKAVFEQLIHKQIPDDLWQKAHYQPGQVLTQLIGSKNQIITFLKKNLTADIVKELQKSPILQEIIQKHTFNIRSNSQAIIA